MIPNLEELKRHVADLSDEALLEIEPGDLVEAARGVYEAELTSRGLAWSQDGQALPAEGLDSGALASIAKFESVEEARFARTMLENEGIPVWFVAELTPKLMSGDPLAGLELVTRTEFVEQAQLVLTTEISEEELARQAEEAAPEAEPEDEEVPIEEERVEEETAEEEHS